MRDDLALLQEEEQKRRSIKQKRWAELQDKSPDTANFISNISKAFGKPRKLAVKYKGEKWQLWK